MGWSYWDLMALPADVYAVLVDQLLIELQRADPARDVA